MYWQLTEDIYWGDYKAVEELKDEVGSVICVATNKDLERIGYNVFSLPPKVRYFRFAEKDKSFPDYEYISSLEGLIEISLLYRPLLVHCFAGQHRSPIIAILASLIAYNKKNRESEYYFDRRLYNSFIEKVKKLNPLCDECWNFDYSRTVQKWIESRIL